MLYHGALICSESSETRISCVDYNSNLVAVGNARGAIFFYRLLPKATRLRPELALHVAPPANDRTLNVTLTCIRFSRCQTYLAVGTALGGVLVFNLRDKSRLDIKCQHDDHRGKAISALCWSSDSSKLFSGCIGGTVIEFIITDSASDWGRTATSTSAMALNFASALLMGKKNTTLICNCEEIVRQIECSHSDSCSCGEADILLVSAARHILLFQLPTKKDLAPRFSNIPHNATSTSNQGHHNDAADGNVDTPFDGIWSAACFCYSYASSGSQVSVSSTPLSEATGIIVAKSCESGIMLSYSSLDGEVLESFKLKGPFRRHGKEGEWDSCCLGVRCLTGFGSNDHKHLMTLITADNCVMLVNLRDMSCDYLLGHYDYSVHAAVPNAGRVIVLYEDIEQEMMVADLVECITPSTPRPPMTIHSSHLYVSITLMKRCWAEKKRKEREREATSPLSACITPVSVGSYHSDSSNSFLYYAPDNNYDSKSMHSGIGGVDCSKSMMTRPCPGFIRSSSDVERAERAREAVHNAALKKLDSLENDLNHALAECDESLEAWAFSAAAVSSLTDLLGNAPSSSTSSSPCVRCCNSKGHNKLGGGGGGARSLDEIVKYGAILSASHEVCLSEEALSQLSSLQQVLCSVDADEPPRDIIEVGYDLYGLEEEEQRRRSTLATAARAKIKARRKFLKGIVAEQPCDADAAHIQLGADPSECVVRESSHRRVGLDNSGSLPNGVRETSSSRASPVPSVYTHSNSSNGSTPHTVDRSSSSDESFEDPALHGDCSGAINSNSHSHSGYDSSSEATVTALIERVDRSLADTYLALELTSMSVKSSSGIQEHGTDAGSGAAGSSSTSDSMDNQHLDQGSGSGTGSGAGPSGRSSLLLRHADIEGESDPWDLMESADRAIALTITAIDKFNLNVSGRGSSNSSWTAAGSGKRSGSSDSDALNDCSICNEMQSLTAPTTPTSTAALTATAATANRTAPTAVPHTDVRAVSATKSRSYSSSNGIGSVSNSTNSEDYSTAGNWGTVDFEDAAQGPAIKLSPRFKRNSKHHLTINEGTAEEKNVSPLKMVTPSPPPSSFPAHSPSPPLPSSTSSSPSSSSRHQASGSHDKCTLPSPFEGGVNSSADKMTDRIGVSDDTVTKCESSETERSFSACATEEEPGPNPFTDSDMSWMEWWWDLDRGEEQQQSQLQPQGQEEERPGLSLKRRICRARSKRRRRTAGSSAALRVGKGEGKVVEGGEAGCWESENPLFAKRSPQRIVHLTDSVASLSCLRREEAPRNMYDVIVIAPRGLGLNLALIPGGSLVIRTFNPLADGLPGPVERTGTVQEGDFLIGINGLSLLGLGLEQIVDVLQNIDKMGEEPTTLTFRFGDLPCADCTLPHLHPTSHSPSHAHANHQGGNQQRALGQSQSPVNSGEEGHTHYHNHGVGDNAITARDRGGDRGGGGGVVSSIRGDGRGPEGRHRYQLRNDAPSPSEQHEAVTAAGGTGTERGGAMPFSFDMDYEDPLFGPIAGSVSKHHSSSDFAARSDMAPAWVEEILLNPLTAVQVAAANINTIGGLESFGLGSWLETMSLTRSSGGVDGYKYRDFQAKQYENNPLCIVPTAIGAREIHAAVRKRHMYPSAAAVSCSSHGSAIAALALKVADEVWHWYSPLAASSGYFLPGVGCEMPPLMRSVPSQGLQRASMNMAMNMTTTAVHVEMFLQSISSFEKASREGLRPLPASHAHPSICDSDFESHSTSLVPGQQTMQSGRGQRKVTIRATETEGGTKEEEGEGESAYTEYHYPNKDFGPDSTLESAPHTYHYNSSTSNMPDALRQDHSTGGHSRLNDSMTSVHATQLQLMADFHFEFSQRVRLADAKRVVKNTKTDDIAANLAPIRLTHRLRELLEFEEYWMRDTNCSCLIALLSTWTQLFIPLSTDHRSKLGFDHLSRAYAAVHGFATNTEMAEFLCVMSDIVTLQFMASFCSQHIRGEAEGDGEGKRMGVVSTSPSPPHALPHTEHPLPNGDNGSAHAETDMEYEMKAEMSEEDEEEGSDIAAEEEEEGIEDGDGDGDGVVPAGFSPRKNRSKILSTSCRLHLLPYRIDFDCIGAAVDRGSASEIDLQLAANSNSNSNADGAPDQVSQRDTGTKRDREMQKEKQRQIRSDLDYSACEYVQQYGAYLNLDLAAACSSLVQLPMALDAILLLTGADQQLDKLSSTLGHTLKSTNPTDISLEQIVDMIFELPHEELKMPLCLVLRHLGSLFKRNEKLATEVCVSLYPQLQPWNVKKTLFGDCSDILGNSSRPEGHSFMPCRHYASAIITHETSGIKLRASEPPVAKKGGVEDRADCKSRKEDCTGASPGRSCSIADPQHACHDALLAWQRSARGYYLKYLMTLMASMRVRKKGGLTRRREEGAYSKFDVGRDVIEDLLQLTLSAMKGADSDNRDGDRDRGDANRGEIALGGHRTHGHFSFSCDVHFQSPRSCSRQTISNIWGQNSQGDKMATCRRVVRYIVSDSLHPVHTASVAAMCAAQGCFFEALSACKLYHTQRTHQRKHRNAGQGVRQSSIVLVGDVAVAEKAVQMALSLCLQALICLVAKRALHTCAERYPVSATHTIDSSRSQKQEDAKLEMSESDASKHLTAALALMRQSFLRAVPGPEHVDTNTVIGGSDTRAASSEEEEEVVMERDIVEKRGEHLLDAVLVPLIAAIMSSPICACPNEAFERSGAQVGEKREKEIGEGKGSSGVMERLERVAMTSCHHADLAKHIRLCEYERECVASDLCSPSHRTDGRAVHGDLTLALLFRTPHTTHDTNTGPGRPSCPPYLGDAKDLIALRISQCARAAFGNKLTRKFVRSLPTNVSLHLHIDFIALLVD